MNYEELKLKIFDFLLSGSINSEDLTIGNFNFI